MDLLGKRRTGAEFERFMAEHADGLLRTGYLITSDLAEAEDLLQDSCCASPDTGRTCAQWTGPPHTRGGS